MSTVLACDQADQVQDYQQEAQFYKERLEQRLKVAQFHLVCSAITTLFSAAIYFWRQDQIVLLGVVASCLNMLINLAVSRQVKRLQRRLRVELAIITGTEALTTQISQKNPT